MDNTIKNRETIVKLENVHICHGKTEILRDVNLEINAGDFYYLIGKVGSGKSTLFKALYGDLPLNSGKGIVAGFDLTRLRQAQVHKLRRKLGIVFQDFQLLTDRSIHKNLTFVLRATGWNNKREIDRQIDSVLEKVEMLDHKDKMPHELSGGEQQRISIARALLNNPEIILADEPTGNLDPESGGQITEILQKIRDIGKAVFMITHNYSLMEKYPEQTIICQNGEISGNSINSSEIDFNQFSKS